MPEKILLVDDDPKILSAIERTLRREFTFCPAVGAEEGLRRLAAEGPFAVVVADRQMPGMDGVRFLNAVREQSPDSVRLMLTGNAELGAVINLVNETGIFRILTKPCTPAVLTKALHDALAQHQLIHAERELLDRTLKGSIKVLVDLLSLLDPDTFKRRNVLRQRIDVLARRLSLASTWELQVAAMLSRIGLVTLPPELAAKVRAGAELDDHERSLVERVPEIGRNLIGNIPRLQGVAQIVYFQSKCYDGLAFPAEPVQGEQIPFGARVLKVLNDLAQHEERGRTAHEALGLMAGCDGWYDPQILAAATECFAHASPTLHFPELARAVDIEDLRAGHVLFANLETNDGHVLFPAGQTITETTLECVRDLGRLHAIRVPILVTAA